MLKKLLLTTACALCVSTLPAGESHYATTPPDVVVAMLDSVGVTATDIVVDLGCGDLRIPIVAAVKYGCKAVGIERDPIIAAVARANIERNSIGHLVSVQQADVLRMHWTPARKVVTVYLDGELLRKLRPVLEKLPPGSRIVSHQHLVPGWKQAEAIEVRGHRLYRYRVERVTRKVKVCGPQGCTYKNVAYVVVKGY